MGNPVPMYHWDLFSNELTSEFAWIALEMLSREISDFKC